jgi:hypothetical protein
MTLPEHAAPGYLALSSPFNRLLNFLGLELVVIACFLLTLRHALTRYRAGDRYPLFQWLVILAYGIAMEMIAFNYLHNYTHAIFTVQLYHRLLPLYVPCIYLVFHYTGLKLVERLGLDPLREALLVGFAICLLDVPFDIDGPGAGWWSWSPSDPNLAVRWLGVPITSYYWYLLFGAVFAGLSRGLRKPIAARSLGVYFAAAPLAGIAIIVLGSIAFLPFHALKALGVSDDLMVAGHLVLCFCVALFVRPTPRRASWDIVAIVVSLYVWHFGVLLSAWASGELDRAPTKLAVFVMVGLASSLLLAPRPALARAEPAARPTN